MPREHPTKLLVDRITSKVHEVVKLSSPEFHDQEKLQPVAVDLLKDWEELLAWFERKRLP